jgi:hypothetical protein
MTGARNAADGRHAERRATSLRAIVGDVVRQAVADAGAPGVIILEDRTPEGELACQWLEGALGTASLWRGASLASNLHGTDVDPADAQLLGAWRLARQEGALIAHPASKTTLLLGGALPRVDVFPLGDLYASQVVQLAGGWSAPADLEAIVAAVGVEAVDGALGRLVDGRMSAAEAFRGVDSHIGEEIARLYARGRHFRLRPRLVPKLGARTLGVDLFD